MNVSLPDINQVITQISDSKSLINKGLNHYSHTAAGNDNRFEDSLRDALGKISNLQHDVKKMSRDFLTGDSDVGINDVMLMQQKSSIALNLSIQTVNKLVSSYREIMSMNI